MTVYIREAHPTDEWQRPSKHHPQAHPDERVSARVAQENEKERICYRQPRTTGERLAIARDFVSRFHYTIPLLVDPIENNFDDAYAGWPERLYVIEGGVIRYKGGTGPDHFQPEELAAWLAARFTGVASPT